MLMLKCDMIVLQQGNSFSGDDLVGAVMTWHFFLVRPTKIQKVQEKKRRKVGQLSFFDSSTKTSMLKARVSWRRLSMKGFGILHETERERACESRTDRSEETGWFSDGATRFG